jgi:hypothetical protein
MAGAQRRGLKPLIRRDSLQNRINHHPEPLPARSQEEMAKDRGDVPCVVATTMVRPFEGQPEPSERVVHANLAG